MSWICPLCQTKNKTGSKCEYCGYQHAGIQTRSHDLDTMLAARMEYIKLECPHMIRALDRMIMEEMYETRVSTLKTVL